MSEPTRFESALEGVESALPGNARAVLESAVEWVRAHPTQAALLGAAGGFLVGMAGPARLFAGARALSALPLVSEAIGAVAKNFGAARAPDSIH